MKTKIALHCLLGITTLSLGISSHASGLLQTQPTYVVSDYAKTKYPIVLGHGMMGFTRLGSSSFGLDYWYQITPDLARNGATVFATQVSPFNSTEVRGEQLLQQVDEVIALTGKPKVNLIGHSHGGSTVQYVEIVAPEKVASATSIAGLMKGSPLADTVVSGNFFGTLVNFVVNFLAPTISTLEGNPSLPYDFKAGFSSISIAERTKFNTLHPTAAIPKDCSHGQKITSNGIYHYSWTGNKQVTNVFDVLDTGFGVIAGGMLGSEPNDSLVPVCNSVYGQVIRNDYNWNHFDEINQVLGLKAWDAQDPVAVFRQHANRLKLDGL